MYCSRYKNRTLWIHFWFSVDRQYILSSTIQSGSQSATLRLDTPVRLSSDWYVRYSWHIYA